MTVEFQPNGIYLPEIDLWLDPRDTCHRAWLSHAHSDHAAGLHHEVWATPPTLRLYRMRWAEQPGFPQLLHAVDYGGSFQLGDACCTVLPAAHILGSAQLLIEYRRERLLYTGDIKLLPPLCGRVTEVVPCDHLIIECTFGLPIYHFLTRDDARRRILDFASEALADQATPVFLGYPLGRGQEVAHVLCQAGIPTAVHGSIARFIPVYEDYGYAFPGWQPYDARHLHGKALVVAPSLRNVLEASPRETRIAYVSGWAAVSSARTRARAEELIPYSDHASFPELLEIIQRANPRRVDLVHGYTEAFASILRARGFDAHAAATLTEVQE